MYSNELERYTKNPKRITGNHTIVNPIQRKKLLFLSYNGIARTVEPHAYGVSSKGNELLRCCHVRRTHNSDKPHDWDLLTVSRITALTDAGVHLAGARPDCNQDDKAMQNIYAQL